MNRKNGVEQNDVPRRKHRGLKALLSLVIIVLAMAGYARYIEPHMLVQRDIGYESEKLSGVWQIDGLKIAIFADTHFSEYYTLDDFEKAARRINAQDPDLIFFLGDLVDDFSTYQGDIVEIERALAELDANVGKFAVYGNHDYGGEMEFKYPDVMKAGGFQLLVNESEYLDEYNLEIMGIDDMVIGYGDPKTAAKLQEDRFNIVLCHEPDIADQLSSYHVDLMFAGHTHGGQIRLPFVSRLMLPQYGSKYIRGAFSLNSEDGNPMELYVTAGLGTTKIPMRFAARPEVNMIRLSDDSSINEAPQ